ncbi:MAG: hypothetical protein CME19_09590 [Gemmatimonadetes bacterium]|nr:hypothetical protein [Gemmatimonadota bacterium]
MDLSRKERAFESRFRKRLAVWPQESPWPGVLLCAALTWLGAIVNRLPFPPFTTADGQHPISTVLLALLLGMFVRNLIPAVTRVKAGIDAMVKKWLPVGIVLLGARLDFYDLLQVAIQVAVGAAILIALLIVLSRVSAAWFGVDPQLGMLIGVGTAICGSSAIVAVSPVVEARDDEMAYSIGTVNLLGVIAMLVYPVLGAIFAVDADVYGAWCGLGIHATPQVIAAGFAYPGDGQTAGEMATIVKLVRISLLGPAVFVVGAWYAHRRRQEAVYIGKPVQYSKLVPGFVVVFLGLALLRTLGFLPEVTLHLTERFILGGGDRVVDVAGLMSQGGKWLITAAMAGVGLSTEFRAMKAGGIRPLLLGVVLAVVIGGMGLLVASI